MPKNLRRVTGLGDLRFMTFCCCQRRSFLATPESRSMAVQILGEVLNRYGFALVGYVFMPQHVHLLVGESKLVSPAIAMQVFKQHVSRRMRSGKREEPALSPFPKEQAETATILAAVQLRLQRAYASEARRKLTNMHENPIKERLVERQAIGRGVVRRTVRRGNGS